VKLYLTFDDGPSRLTPSVLDALAAQGARASFFVLGEHVAGNEETLRRTAAEGHTVGNHGWSHRRFTELADDEIRAELERTAAAVEQVTGARPHLWRPPHGDTDPRVDAVAGEPVLWDVDPLDWTGISAVEIVATVLAGARDGAIVDLHDGRRAGQATVDAVIELLPALQARGFELAAL
jgi:peptidoglycan/xylan/chitin deacetylase (PgdA/CDA1 family)